MKAMIAILCLLLAPMLVLFAQATKNDRQLLTEALALLSQVQDTSGQWTVTQRSAFRAVESTLTTMRDERPPDAPPPPPPPVPPSSEFPTATTTGIPSGVTPRNCSASTLATANAVIDGCVYAGDVLIMASNVTIKNSAIRGRVRNTSNQHFELIDTTIGPATGCMTIEAVGYGNYTATRVRLQNVSDGFRVSGNDVTVKDSFVTMCSMPGDHSDGVQGYQGGLRVVIDHNTIDQRGADDVNAVIFFADNSKSATVTNNLLIGGGYTLRIHDDAAADVGPWVITGNRIVDHAWNFGPVSTTNTRCPGISGSKTTWADNRLVTIGANYEVLTTGATVNCH